MNFRTIATLSLTTALFSLNLCADNWPNWRGPNHDGTVSDGFDYPTKWTDKNVRWRIPLPAEGNSTPIIWEDYVVITQSLPETKERTTMCFNRATGKLLWQSGVTYTEDEQTWQRPRNPYCSGSPVTDGERIYASYSSAGVICHDFAGKQLWQTDLGKVDHQFGNGTSPMLVGDYVVLYQGPGESSFLAALEKETGKIAWKVERPQPVQGASRKDNFRGNAQGAIASYITPLIVENSDRKELVMGFPEFIVGLNPKTGEELWRCGGINPLLYASPVLHGKNVIFLGGYGGPSIAVKTGGNGDVTATNLVWSNERASSHLPTGVIKDDHLYTFTMNGMAECIDVKTGALLWQERAKGEGRDTAFWGSAVLAGENLYCVNRSGDVIVLKANPTFGTVTANPLGEVCNATPALSNGQIFFRTHEALWCIEKDQAL
jgi:outer membrane protein assembly factor BamB